MVDQTIKLLVVDDEPGVGDMLKNYLSTRQYEVSIAYSGEEALKTLEAQSVDLVLLDILMHGLNGDAVAKIIKDKYPTVKIFILTGFPEAADRIAREVPVDGLFLKHYGLQDIYAKLQNLQLS